MMVEVRLTREPIVLPDPNPADLCLDEVGAIVRFTGVVRGREAGQPIVGLTYEAYESMALSETTRLLDALTHRHELLGARVVHRIGFVPVGEPAIVVELRSRHREHAFLALAEFMTQLKLDVPIWKTGTSVR